MEEDYCMCSLCPKSIVYRENYKIEIIPFPRSAGLRPNTKRECKYGAKIKVTNTKTGCSGCKECDGRLGYQYISDLLIDSNKRLEEKWNTKKGNDLG